MILESTHTYYILLFWIYNLNLEHHCKALTYLVSSFHAGFNFCNIFDVHLSVIVKDVLMQKHSLNLRKDSFKYLYYPLCNVPLHKLKPYSSTGRLEILRPNYMYFVKFKGIVNGLTFLFNKKSEKGSLYPLEITCLIFFCFYFTSRHF